VGTIKTNTCAAANKPAAGYLFATALLLYSAVEQIFSIGQAFFSVIGQNNSNVSAQSSNDEVLRENDREKSSDVLVWSRSVLENFLVIRAPSLIDGEVFLIVRVRNSAVPENF
jgi:hypothetical protein